MRVPQLGAEQVRQRGSLAQLVRLRIQEHVAFVQNLLGDQLLQEVL